MWMHVLPHFLVGVLAVLFAGAGIFDVAGSGYLRARFRPWQYPRQFYRVMGMLQLVAALFLAVPQLRIWGIIVASLVIFFWIVILLNHRQWSWAVAGMLIMIALVPASLAIYS
jgi:DoxX-like family